jgi:hypothetical protein
MKVFLNLCDSVHSPIQFPTSIYYEEHHSFWRYEGSIRMSMRWIQGGFKADFCLIEHDKTNLQTGG